MREFLAALSAYPWTAAIVGLWTLALVALIADGVGAYHDRK